MLVRVTWVKTKIVGVAVVISSSSISSSSSSRSSSKDEDELHNYIVTKKDLSLSESTDKSRLA